MAAPTSPAWYKDPEDPVQLRHWNGRTWDARHRTVPAWAVGTRALAVSDVLGGRDQPVLEGPVHPAGLPAIAAANAQSSRPRNRRPTPRPAVGAGGATRTGTASPGWSTGTRPARGATWSSRRLSLITVAALVGLVVLVLAATFGVAPQPSSTPTLAEDAVFTNAANIDCGEAMGAIRLVPVPAMTAAGTASNASPSAVAAANRDLVQLAAKLRALPVIDAARSSIQGWLNLWSRFAADRQRQADAANPALPSDHAPAAGTSSASTVSLDADAADAFATTNDLGSCTLTPSSSAVAAP